MNKITPPPERVGVVEMVGVIPSSTRSFPDLGGDAHNTHTKLHLLKNSEYLEIHYCISPIFGKIIIINNLTRQFFRVCLAMYSCSYICGSGVYHESISCVLKLLLHFSVKLGQLAFATQNFLSNYEMRDLKRY